MDLAREFAHTAQIMDANLIRYELFPRRQTFEDILNAWKLYRHENYVRDVYGEPTEPGDKMDDALYAKYQNLFDNLTMNDSGNGSELDNEPTSKLWLCIVMESGDEVIIKYVGGKLPFTLLYIQFSRVPNHVSRNVLSTRDDCCDDSHNSECSCEYLVSLLHQ